ncbi:hypothetical protein ACWEQ4_01195 [Rhodococcus sp. NPDC003994]
MQSKSGGAAQVWAVMLGGVFLLALAIKFVVPLVGAGVIVCGALYYGHRVNVRRDREEARRARIAGLTERAAVQHQAYLAGDDSGIYGDFTPSKLD